MCLLGKLEKGQLMGKITVRKAEHYEIRVHSFFKNYIGATAPVKPVHIIKIDAGH